MKKMWIFALILIAGSALSGNNIALSKSTMRFEIEKSGDAVWNARTQKKLVALTFDDGPHPEYTPDILKLLKKYHAKSTFFVIGELVKQYPEIVQEEVKNGHEIANHTFSHHFRSNLSKKHLKKELKKTEEIIREITGVSTAFFRPIGGYYNQKIVQTARNSGYRVIIWTWNQDSKDWKEPGAEKIAENILSDTMPGDIILMHDGGGDRSQTVKALEIILPQLKKAGYEMVTVSELLMRTEYDGFPFYLP
ncbi:polysaccharide deacetylase family protein [Bacillus sp. FJAT-49736]|uniref:polysaccharide deacetylase family protein n=1 Tax=Bacillus sp. FJAT-49736 TaxID=2833582 RepID=UPI001BC94113|nr:polysaccharide deacetylase family protein [Bacillus sp. FJAT-49736]MBS4172621.1 polysaccharide deacetylase family protein [Bacillus sp. FJAT-49736]